MMKQTIGTATTIGFIKHERNGSQRFPVKVDWDGVANVVTPRMRHGHLVYALPGGGEFTDDKIFAKE